MMLCFIFSALIVILDQFFKQWVVRTIEFGSVGPEIIPGVLGLTHWENDGAMLNFLSGQQWLLAAIAFFAAVILVVILLRYNEGFWGTLALAAVLGGTVGNLMDRVFNGGKVIDMFRTLFINFPIFNIADIFITLGFFTFLIHFIALTFKEEEPEGNAAKSSKKHIEDDYDDQAYQQDDVVSLDDIAPVIAAAPAAPAAPAAEPAPVMQETQAVQAQITEEEYVAAPEEFDATTDTTPDISFTLESLDLDSDLDDLDVDYDVDELLREYGIEDD